MYGQVIKQINKIRLKASFENIKIVQNYFSFLALLFVVSQKKIL